MATPVYPATNNAEAIELNISNANQFFTILQGGIDDFIVTYEGNGEVPSVAKALHEAAAYKTPLLWQESGQETDLMQPRIYQGVIYAPMQVPADFTDPLDSTQWRLLQNNTTKSNFTAEVDPSENDDVTEGYSVGSLWFNRDTAETFRCIDTTEGAAVWVHTSLTIDELGALALGNSASDVPYNNSASGLSATTTQGAIDELEDKVSGKIDSVVAGGGVNVDNTDPRNPVISATSLGAFAGLSDTPSTYAGFEGYYVRVNVDGTGLEFVSEISGGDY